MYFLQVQYSPSYLLHQTENLLDIHYIQYYSWHQAAIQVQGDHMLMQDKQVSHNCRAMKKQPFSFPPNKLFFHLRPLSLSDFQKSLSDSISISLYWHHSYLLHKSDHKFSQRLYLADHNILQQPYLCLPFQDKQDYCLHCGIPQQKMFLQIPLPLDIHQNHHGLLPHQQYPQIHQMSQTRMLILLHPHIRIPVLSQSPVLHFPQILVQ